MTQESHPDHDITETYKQLNDAELQATKLEQMLDNLDAKMDSILQQAEKINEDGNHQVDQTNQDQSDDKNEK